MDQIVQLLLMIFASFFIFLVIVSIVCEFTSRELVCSDSIKRLGIIVFVLILTAMAFVWTPKYNDLTRHMQQMETIRHQQMSFFSFLFRNTLGEYKYLYTFNIYRYLIARLFTNNHMLPAITVFIIYGIWGYILYQINQKGKKWIDGTTFFLCSTFIPFIFSNSGIRNGLAASIAALSIFRYLQNPKKKVSNAIILFMAILIHPVVALTIPIVILSLCNFQYWSYLIVVLLGMAAPKISECFFNSGKPFLHYLGEKFSAYTAASQYYGSKFYLYGDLILMICVLLAWLITDKEILKEKFPAKYCICRFQVLYILFVMSFVGNYDMILRPMYMIGILAPTLQPLFDKHLWKPNYRLVGNTLKMICVFIGLYVLKRYMTEYILCQIWY